MKPLQIAIDGPVAAGKGDIAARIAKKFGLLYVYTGAMYRALALACIRKGIPTKDTQGVLDVLDKSTIELVDPGRANRLPYKVLLNGEDVTEEIFQQRVAMGASDVSTIPQVRVFMVERQKELARGKAVVMEGRDIGLRVLPKAQLKIYLTASVEERAHRRWLQWKEKSIEKSLEEVIDDTKKRDVQDTMRRADPLQRLPDAWELDTTAMDQQRVVDAIEKELTKRNLL